MAGRINQLGGVILMGMGAWLGYNVLTGKSLEHSAEDSRREWTFLWKPKSEGWGNSVYATNLKGAKEQVLKTYPKGSSFFQRADLSTLTDDPMVNKQRWRNWDSQWNAESFGAEWVYEDDGWHEDMTDAELKQMFDEQMDAMEQYQLVPCRTCGSKEIGPEHPSEGSLISCNHCGAEYNIWGELTMDAESFSAEAVRSSRWECGKCGADFDDEEEAEECCPCQHKNWEWIDVGGDLSYAQVVCLDCDAGGMHSLNIIEGWDAESFSADHDAKGYYEPYAFCEFCSDEIQKEGDAVTLRGEIICKDCKEAWDEQPDDGGFRAETEDSQWSEEDYRGAVSEIAWGDMTDREPFDDEETLDQLHRYSQQAYGFEELSTLLRRQIYEAGEPCYCNDNDPDFMCYTCEVLEIIDNKDYEAEGHKMMADNFMPPSMLWNEEDDDADEDALAHYTGNSIKDEGSAAYMAEQGGSRKSRFMKESEVIDLFKKANGTLVSVTFVKRTNGEVRKMLARTSVKKGVKGVGLKFNPKNKKLMGVYDFEKVREGADPWKCYRFVPIDAVLSMRVRGKTYTA